ncbi:MAG TPA: DUF3231 family protein [Desulfosporosinus sp.]|nr:DUF3231 family protein [Desulfosporosinus sp.]
MDSCKQGNVCGYHVIQHDLDNISLTSSEIGLIWRTYLCESMAKCYLSYFVEKSKDPDTRAVLKFALEGSRQHINDITDIFKGAKFPIPYGFTEEDFDVTAKKLFSDSFMLTYTRFEARYSMVHFSLAFSNSVRPDICGFFEGCLKDSIELFKKANDVLLAKGLLERTPYIPIPNRVEYVHDVANYFKGLMGEKRPINALEIEQCFVTAQSKLIERTIILGLVQVVKSKILKDYLLRGKQIADKQIEVLGSILLEEDLAIPTNSIHQVSDSKEAPFSDKLILFSITAFSSLSMTGLGTALANCARKDILLALSRLNVEVANYAKGGLDLMITQGWLERTPEAPNRKELRSQRE